MPSLRPDLFWFILGTLSGSAGCAPSALEGGFDSPNPSARAYAIEKAAVSGDRSTIPRLVEQLTSDDPLVRMMAISTLEGMTGQRLGFRHYDLPALRREAVQRWVDAVHSGRFDVADSSEKGMDG